MTSSSFRGVITICLITYGICLELLSKWFDEGDKLTSINRSNVTGSTPEIIMIKIDHA